MPSPASLEVTGLSYSYGGISALKDVGFSVGSGQILAILGPNGAGKTTLGACIAGLHKTEQGSVCLDGKDISAAGICDRARDGIVYVPEGGAVFPSLTVSENLLVGRKLSIPDNQILEQAAAYFPFLAARRKQRAGLLSGGEQRMLALARILVAKPKLTVIDELSHGLAPIIVDQLFAALDAARGVTTLVMIEQFLTRAYAISDSLLVLSTGDPLYQGPTSDISVSDVEAMYSLGTSSEIDRA